VIANVTLRDARVAWHARWVLVTADRLLDDAAVVVDGERVVWVGPAAEAEAGRHEQLGACVLMPGLINAHTW